MTDRSERVRWGFLAANARIWSWAWSYPAMGGPEDSLGRELYSGRFGALHELPADG